MAEEIQTKGKINKFLLESKRIFAIAKKPTKKEYNTTLKITLVGLVLTGGISYVIQLIATILKSG
jgi:protein translocase SEC61 complex gamma subunit